MSIVRDYQAYAKHCNSRIKPIVKVMFYVCVIFRLSNFFYRIKLTPVGRVFWLINRVLFSIDIDPRASLMGGMVILHGAGIVIGKSVKAYGDFKIYQGVTLGGNNGKRSEYNGQQFSQPILMENVVLGINSCVLGPVILKDNCKIGANAIVTKNVDSNVTIVSNNVVL